MYRLHIPQDWRLYGYEVLCKNKPWNCILYKVIYLIIYLSSLAYLLFTKVELAYF